MPSSASIMNQVSDLPRLREFAVELDLNESAGLYR